MALRELVQDWNPEHLQVILGAGLKRLVDARRIASYRRILEERRITTDPFDEDEPLVSIRIPTYNRSRLLAERSLPSALRQTYRNLEVVVVGDHCSDDTEDRIRSFGDPRIRFVNLPQRPRYPRHRRYYWMSAGALPMTEGVRLSRGRWIAPLDDDDEFSPDHIEVLLAACLRNRWEFGYGVLEMEKSPGVFQRVGTYPLRHGQICHASVLYSAILDFVPVDPLCWLLAEPTDWNLWRKFLVMGVRYGFVDRVVGVHYLEKTLMAPVTREVT